MIALALLVAMNCYPSTVPGYPILCVATKKMIVPPAPSPTPQPTSTPTIAPTATPVPPTPSPSPEPTETPSAAPTDTPAPPATVVWKAGDSKYGKWKPATDGQCNTPIITGTQIDFSVTQNGQDCTRNQIQLLDAGGNGLLLTNGVIYSISWTQFDGPLPGMGPDKDARQNYFQLHGNVETDSPCTGLDGINGPNNLSQPQMFGFSTCAGLVWHGDYTPGETDQWLVRMKVSSASDGWTELWRNGQLQGHWDGANFHNSKTNQAWPNFGIYAYRWKVYPPQGGGSSMTTKTQRFTDFVITTP
jgi:hypothetical protein